MILHRAFQVSRGRSDYVCVPYQDFSFFIFHFFVIHSHKPELFEVTRCLLSCVNFEQGSSCMEKGEVRSIIRKPPILFELLITVSECYYNEPVKIVKIHTIELNGSFAPSGIKELASSCKSSPRRLLFSLQLINMGRHRAWSSNTYTEVVKL